jgi:hypothetical protein
MSIGVLSCANCGAPLTKQTADVWPCIHCGALSRVKDGAAEVESKVPDEVMASLRQLVISGKRDEAAKLAAQHGLPADSVESLFKSIMVATLFGQKLNALGWTMMFVFFGLTVWGIWLVSRGWRSALLIVGFGVLNLLIFRRSMMISFEMMGKPKASATVRRVTPIGVDGVVHIFALEIDVEPADKSMGFRASLVVPVRQATVAQVVVGLPIQVRYAPDRSWVRLAKRIG